MDALNSGPLSVFKTLGKSLLVNMRLFRSNTNVSAVLSLMGQHKANLEPQSTTHNNPMNIPTFNYFLRVMQSQT